MADHHVDKMYIRLFDVERGIDAGYADWNMVPTATTRFLQPLPADIDVVPVVYITVDAIRTLNLARDKAHLVDTYARLIVKRIDEMMTEHWGFPVREVQLDCDWTTHTKTLYFALAQAIKTQLNLKGITLSATLRLHQLRIMEQATPDLDVLPFDRTLLMCYNTGRLQDPLTNNSILDIDDVMPYLKQYHSDSLPSTDVAYPVYGWGVEFDREGNFRKIVHSQNLEQSITLADSNNVVIREEWGNAKDIKKVQQSLPTLDIDHTTILYHLDSFNLSHYSYEDIEKFYSR